MLGKNSNKIDYLASEWHIITVKYESRSTLTRNLTNHAYHFYHNLLCKAMSLIFLM